MALQYLSADSQNHLQQSWWLHLSGIVILPLYKPYLRQTWREREGGGGLGMADEDELRGWRRGELCLWWVWDKSSSQVDARDFWKQVEERRCTKRDILCRKVKDFQQGGNVCHVLRWLIYFYSQFAQVKIQEWMTHTAHWEVVAGIN